jgi:hypothetical protein
MRWNTVFLFFVLFQDTNKDIAVLSIDKRKKNKLKLDRKTIESCVLYDICLSWCSEMTETLIKANV